MIKIYLKDVTKIKDVEYICAPANAIGTMGTGVANVIRRAAGGKIEHESLQICVNNKIQPGDIYITSAGNLKYKGVVHAVITKKLNEETDLNVIRQCLKSLISFCVEENIKDIALPSFGTRKINKNELAKMYTEELKDTNIKFHIVGKDRDFIKYMNNWIERIKLF